MECPDLLLQHNTSVSSLTMVLEHAEWHAPRQCQLCMCIGGTRYERLIAVREEPWTFRA